MKKSTRYNCFIKSQLKVNILYIYCWLYLVLWSILGSWNLYHYLMRLYGLVWPWTWQIRDKRIHSRESKYCFKSDFIGSNVHIQVIEYHISFHIHIFLIFVRIFLIFIAKCLIVIESKLEAKLLHLLVYVWPYCYLTKL